MADALGREWDRDAIIAYARSNDWDRCVSILVDEFAAIVARHAGARIPEHAPPAKPSLLS
jgi:teichuronic acid biosynthesis glycosyltransferase TuaC